MITAVLAVATAGIVNLTVKTIEYEAKYRHANFSSLAWVIRGIEALDVLLDGCIQIRVFA